VKIALELHELRPHDDLLKAGKLKEWQPGMLMIFVSHQWRGRKHPDPGMKQFHVLQGCLRNIIAGKCMVESNWMSFLYFNRDEKFSAILTQSFADAYIWYDYFCVPQLGTSYDPMAGEMLMRAVNSIPEYVCMCQYFFVLCPELVHEAGHPLSFLTWQQRGWCLMEEIARRLGHFNEMVVVITGEDQASLHESQDYLSHPVALGGFACCELNHVCDGVSIPCDKEKISVIVQSLLSQLITEKSTSKDTIDLFYFRLLRSLRPNLLEGLPQLQERLWQTTPVLMEETANIATPEERFGESEKATHPVEIMNSALGSVKAFLHDYNFSQTARFGNLCTCESYGLRFQNDDGGVGWGPLFFAVLQGNFEVAGGLIKQGGDVDQRSTGQAPGILIHAGSTPLIVVSWLLHGDSAARFLLGAKANPCAKNSNDQSPLNMSAMGGHAKLTAALLEGGADHKQCDHLGGQSLLPASSFARFDCCKTLIDCKADILNTNIFGACALHGAAQSGDHETLCLLLDRRADVDQKHVPRTTFASVAYFGVSSMLNLGVKKPALEGIGQAQLGTALMSAALHGKDCCVSELIKRKADQNLKNNMGKTALELAQLRSHHETADLLAPLQP